MNDYTRELVQFDLMSDQLLRVQGLIAVTFREKQQDPDSHIVYLQPWIYPPEGFRSYDVDGSVIMGVPPTGFVDVLTLVVPHGFDGVIKRYSCNVEAGGFVDNSGDILWRILADNRPIANYEAIGSQRGSASQPRQIDGIRIYSGQVIKFQVNHVANVAFTNQRTVVSLGGYFYPNST